MHSYFYLFMKLLSVFFLFLSKCKYNGIKLCYNRLQFVKETQMSTEWKTQSGEPNYLNHKFFFDTLLATSCTTTWGQTSKHCRAR